MRLSALARLGHDRTPARPDSGCGSPAVPTGSWLFLRKSTVYASRALALRGISVRGVDRLDAFETAGEVEAEVEVEIGA